jgi:hypothetical protein
MQTYSSRQSNLAEDASQLMMRIAHIILFVGVPVSAAFSRRGVFILMPLGLALILLAAAMNMPQGGLLRIKETFLHPAVLFLWALIAWMGFSLVWTPYFGPASERFIKTGGTLLLAACAAGALPARIKTSYLYLLLTGLGLGALAALISYASGESASLIGFDSDVSLLERSALGLNLLLWPALAAAFVRERQKLAVIFVFITALTLILVNNKAGMIALALAILSAGLSLKNSRYIAGFWGVLFALTLGLAPLLMLTFTPSGTSESYEASGLLAGLSAMAELFRIEGWRLLTGHGFDSYLRSVNNGVLPSSSLRSGVFELWYELGFWGVVAVIGLLLILLKRSLNQSREIAPFHIGAIVYVGALAILGQVSFQLWWITLIALLGFAFSLVARGRYRNERPAMRITGQRPRITELQI